mmetsp:Transcript_4808/g.10161  ORF Transcript_4808/g.10161 Transcript_4808/m.10161 type:complete len:261 (-) Transcript_4808:341-1123(-)
MLGTDASLIPAAAPYVYYRGGRRVGGAGTGRLSLHRDGDAGRRHPPQNYRDNVRPEHRGRLSAVHLAAENGVCGGRRCHSRVNDLQLRWTQKSPTSNLRGGVRRHNNTWASGSGRKSAVRASMLGRPRAQDAPPGSKTSTAHKVLRYSGAEGAAEEVSNGSEHTHFTSSLPILAYIIELVSIYFEAMWPVTSTPNPTYTSTLKCSRTAGSRRHTREGMGNFCGGCAAMAPTVVAAALVHAPFSSSLPSCPHAKSDEKLNT